MERSEKINCQHFTFARVHRSDHTNASSHKDTLIVNACSSIDHPIIYSCLRNKMYNHFGGKEGREKRRGCTEGTG